MSKLIIKLENQNIWKLKKGINEKIICEIYL